MKPVTIIFITITGLVTSCYKVYDPDIDSNKKVLMVNGMITNKTDAYHVVLTYAKPFNSSEKSSPVNAANVYITDDQSNSYQFNEMDKGDYVSDSLQFTGIPGRTYRLHIVTPDGEEYESDLQRLFSEVSPDSVYAEFDSKEILERTTGLKVNKHGANILTDIRNQSDSLPRYRFASNLVMQYFYTIGYWLSWDYFLTFEYYCWQTVNANPDINLTGAEYSSNSAPIRKHPVCFLEESFNVYAPHYGLKFNLEDTTGSASESYSYRNHDIHHRILYLNQYTLNNETYIYYKSLNEQMQSEGKLFDPVAVQLNGNIKCITDPEKIAIGFFEASSVSYSAYIVDFRNLINSLPSLIRTPYILPPEPVGCRINRWGSIHQNHNIPSFWIF
ncbi:MAG: DUF4249 domain-containing protein [Bacteroidia bacterium]|nr:DUF4249 domain-containing protein [Bacteroidia bacterium]